MRRTAPFQPAFPSMLERSTRPTVRATAMLAVVLTALGVALFAPTTAAAQGLSTPTIGTGQSTTATRDAAAVYFNPAMTAFLEAPTILVGGSLIVGDLRIQRERRATYQRADSLDFALPIDPARIDQTKTGDAEQVVGHPIGVAPTAFGTHPFADGKLTAGLGVYAPYAAIVKYPYDGPQRWQLQQATIAAIHFSPTIAWRAHRRFAIGAGASYVLGFAELRKIQDFAAVDDVGRALETFGQTNDFGADAPPGVRELDVMARPFALRRAWAHGGTFHVGAAAEPVDGFHLGVTYHHGVLLRYRGDFTLDMNDPFFTDDNESQGLDFAPRVTGDATLRVRLPGALLFGMDLELANGRAGIGLQLAYTLWSQLDSFDVKATSPDLAQPDVGLTDTTRISLARRWENTLGIDVIGRFRATDAVTLWARGGFRQSAVPDETIDAASPDGDRIVAGVGGRVRLTERYAIIGDASVQTTLKREVVGSDFDLGNGSYRLTLVSLGLHLEAQL